MAANVLQQPCNSSVADPAAQQAPLQAPTFKPGTASHPKILDISVATNGQQEQLSTQFPGIYVPDRDSTVDEVVEAARLLGRQTKDLGDGQDTSLVRQLLNTHGGALHFRNLPLRTADDYSRFLHALAEGAGWQPHVDKGLRVLRRVLAKNVATANDGPPEAPIGLHNEYGLSHHYPSYISFFCLSPPDKGGETPIASSLEVHDCLKDRVPDFIEAIEKQGIAFGIHYPVEQIVNSMAGNNLYAASAFGPSDGTVVDHLEEHERRLIAEDNVRALSAAGGWRPDLTTGPYWQRRGFEAQWQADGTMLVHQRVPGVRSHPNFQRPTYFTNLLNGYMWAEEHGSLDPPHVSKKTTLGGGLPFLQVPPKIVGEAADGSEDVVIPKPWIEAVKSVSKEVAVAVQWQIGDVLLLDNLAVQHGRNPWQGDRRLLASLWDAQKQE